VLRDGVYVLPSRDDLRAALGDIGSDVRENGGAAHLLDTQTSTAPGFAALFDRSGEFGQIIAAIAKARGGLAEASAFDVGRQARKLRRAFVQLVAIDFYPGEAQRQAEAALLELEVSARRALSPGEPHPVAGAIPARKIADYRGRVWATRARPWVDRLASAWLIRRFIDADARILWLAAVEACPDAALGFDFDGATFSHVGAKVTFETLVASFGLDSPALARIGAIVHFLDAGGVEPPEASGIERVLAGLRASIADDDKLLLTAAGVFDGLLAAFAKDAES
jgi:hypothetical protein